ncbi:hypothetical protein DRO25_02140 [Candidatus Bathyarchaeota archaeon]|nr:MAG: hypothetical protein DRO25_02140 [Candidatus Bathyarchaeota archaeon]
MNRRGQFSLIAALLVAVVLISTVIVTYSVIRNAQISVQPQVLSAVDETNLALKQVLGFTVGYYGSVLQVTGNASYARMLATNYLKSGFINIADMHPEWGASFNLSKLNLHTYWFTNSSYSSGNLAVNYSLTGLGLSGITYETSCKLSVQIMNTTSNTQVRLNVARDETNEPLINLGKRNFKFYRYQYINSTWELVSPNTEPTSFANGTYLIDVPSEIDPYSYVIQIEDSRGIIVVASSFSRYTCTLNWSSVYSNSTLQHPTMVVELLQNGTMRWLGQNLRITTEAKPIPPIPVKALHVNQTINGLNREVPFQVEDWASNYRIPLGLTNNESVFNSRTMLVFLVNPNVSKVTIWWNGNDNATQTPYAYVDRYFKGDNPSSGILTNGLLTLQFGGGFTLTSTIGSSSCTAHFMRINNEWSVYGSSLAYVIYHGVIRDIIHQEAEWGGGATDCPNLYAHIVLTLPANATYYTYQFRLMFVQSQQSRSLYDFCPIQLKTTVDKSDWGSEWSKTMTENGTSAGYPIIFNNTGFFYNLSGVWQHHWSELIENNHGFGVMMTTTGNEQLYFFDSIAGGNTGGIDVANEASGSSQTITIEIKPASQQAQFSFQQALDVIWYGAVALFDGQDPIYTDAGGADGLWMLVEYLPMVTVTTES